MKRRDTERPHYFAEQVFNKFNIFDLQGLLIGEDGEFTAAVEAFDLDNGEVFHLEDAFPQEDIIAKMHLAEAIGVPFYIITSNPENNFNVYRIGENEAGVSIISATHYNPKEFLNFWSDLKKTIQTKDYYDLTSRIDKSRVDSILEANGQKWGGNVDGFIVSRRNPGRIVGIVEKRVTTKSMLNEYDPAKYFSYRGGDFKTWEPVVNLAMLLEVPLFLMTFQKDNDEQVGVAVIERLTQDGIYYSSNVSPNTNIFSDLRSMAEWMRGHM